MKKTLRHLVAAAALAAFGAHAQQGGEAPQAEGEVRKIDREQGKLTLRHGPLKNLDMPAMTMVFRVADPKLLDSLKEGDQVRFTAEKRDGVYTVVAIQPAR